MIEQVLMWGEPKPGHEFQYHLAWKHRVIAFAWLKKADRNPFAFRAQRRAFDLWGNAVDRIKRHGQHVTSRY